MKTLAFTVVGVVLAGLCNIGAAADTQQVRPELQNPYNFPAPAPPRAMPGAVGVLTTNAAQRAAQLGGGVPLFLTLSGTTVNDISGQSVGAVQYAMVGPNGTLDLAVLLINGRLVPVPWQLISAGTDTTPTPGRVALTANVDRQRLLQAPAVSPSQLPQLLQDSALQGIYAYFGLQAPNQIAAQGSVGVQTNALTGTASGGLTNAFGVATNVTGTTPSAAIPTGTNVATTGTNAISPPPSTGAGAISGPQQGVIRGNSSDANTQRPQISRPPDLGPGSQGTPPPAPQPAPGQR